MNKIKLEDNIFLNNGIYFLEINKDSNITINTKENTSSKLVILGTNNYNIKYIISNNSSLTINSLNKDNNVNIDIYLNDNSDITYNHSVSNKLDSINNFNINHLESNSKSILNNYGVNLANNKLFFKIDGIINKKLSNINCNQSSKIINYAKGNSKIIPNLIIDSNDIIANHSAYIGEINEEELFYMKSRGITDSKIKDLIYKAVLLGKMDLDKEKDLFNKCIDEWR